MAKRGRPTRYNQEYHCLLAEYHARQGMIDTEIAEKLGIAVSTLNLWKTKHPEFLEALKKGKDFPDAKVEQSLYRRATGYDYVEIETFGDRNKPGKVRKIEKHAPPDVTACIFWLKNRCRDRWRDSQHIKYSDAEKTQTALDVLVQEIEKYRKAVKDEEANKTIKDESANGKV